MPKDLQQESELALEIARFCDSQTGIHPGSMGSLVQGD
jgi:hypothetical protein